jgi:hypothetical protein
VIAELCQSPRRQYIPPVEAMACCYGQLEVPALAGWLKLTSLGKPEAIQIRA